MPDEMTHNRIDPIVHIIEPIKRFVAKVFPNSLVDIANSEAGSRHGSASKEAVSFMNQHAPPNIMGNLLKAPSSAGKGAVNRSLSNVSGMATHSSHGIPLKYFEYDTAL